MCTLPSPWTTLKDHKKNLISALRIFRDNLPKTLVFVVTPPHLKEAVAIGRGRDSMWSYYFLSMFCSCLFGLKNADQRSIYYEIMERFVYNFQIV